MSTFEEGDVDVASFGGELGGVVEQDEYGLAQEMLVSVALGLRQRRHVDLLVFGSRESLSRQHGLGNRIIEVYLLAPDVQSGGIGLGQEKHILDNATELEKLVFDDAKRLLAFADVEIPIAPDNLSRGKGHRDGSSNLMRGIGHELPLDGEGLFQAIQQGIEVMSELTYLIAVVPQRNTSGEIGGRDGVDGGGKFIQGTQRPFCERMSGECGQGQSERNQDEKPEADPSKMHLQRGKRSGGKHLIRGIESGNAKASAGDSVALQIRVTGQRLRDCLAQIEAAVLSRLVSDYAAACFQQDSGIAERRIGTVQHQSHVRLPASLRRMFGELVLRRHSYRAGDDLQSGIEALISALLFGEVKPCGERDHDGSEQ